MKKLFVLLAVPALLLTTGCGNICSRAESASKTLEEKTAACNTNGGTQTEPFNRDACEADMAKCSSADHEIMNKVYDCFDKLPKCEAGSELAFAAEFLKCAEGQADLSQACKDALAAN